MKIIERWQRWIIKRYVKHHNLLYRIWNAQRTILRNEHKRDYVVLITSELLPVKWLPMSVKIKLIDMAIDLWLTWLKKEIGKQEWTLTYRNYLTDPVSDALYARGLQELFYQ